MFVGARRAAKNTLVKKVAQNIESVSLDLEYPRDSIYRIVKSIAKTMYFRNLVPIIHTMLDRLIEQTVLNTIEQTPAVVLVGAHQVGKTTLAKKIAKDLRSVYLDLENPRDLLRLSDPLSYFNDNKNKLIILDEIQRIPELFSTLRGVIDNNRWEGRKAKQYLLLGSASIQLLRQSSESLAGRISYLELGGLNVLEIDQDRAEIKNRWLRGGFPESFLAENSERSMIWLENLVETYLERDIPNLAFQIPSTRLRQLWTMLAHLQGETVNYSKLSGNLEIDGKTVSRYIDVLTDLLLVRRLMPWHENVKKRLVKSPRYYVRDSGILHCLLGIHDFDSLLSHPVLGKSWEGFVIENIHSVLPRLAKTYYYRATTGAEIDLLIKFGFNDIWAIEIKFGVAPKISNVFGRICDDVGANRKYVVYGGDEEFSIGNGTTMISLPRLLRKIQNVN